MRRYIVLMMLTLLCASCATTPVQAEEDPNTLTGTVLLAQDDYLVKSDKIGLFRLTKGDGDLSAGDEVRIEFDGMVLESYPAQLGKVSNVTVTGNGPDAIGLLVERYQMLAGQDSLGDDTAFLYVDLNQLTIFDTHQKFALLQALTNIEKRRVEEASLDSLKQNGKFDEKLMVIPDGTLLTLESSNLKKDSFTLKLSIYRSALGAIGVSYAVNIQEYTWQFKLLEQWISFHDRTKA